MKIVLKHLLFLIVSVSFLNCGSISRHPARWDSTVTSSDVNKFVYWKEGIQFVSMEREGLFVTVSGIATNKLNAYIFVTIFNDREEPVDFFPAYSKLEQAGFDYIAVRPLRIRKQTAAESSFLNILYSTSIVANSVAAASSKNAYEASYYSNKAQYSAMENAAIQKNLNDQQLDQIQLLLKNNSIAGGESYTGAFYFQKVNKDKGPFDMLIKVGDSDFKFRGRFVDGTRYDELDLPDQIREIVFE